MTDEIWQYRFDRIRTQQRVADQRYYFLVKKKSEAAADFNSHPSEETRRRYLEALRESIENLELLYSLDLHVAALAKGVDPEWDKEAENGVAATAIRLEMNYDDLRPGSRFGLTIADL
ncbi:hypothetical protein [Pseudonocardia oroxyli]|uniref:Uncharacterized protein n=1 Tax=Pseudonocardia oroxyli TaxID=366584 RepID=A0A1G7SXP2_PSEOR|nr:hypothetical protein [Pseudonocardia oroxyli]SDG27642.1 hypothetical protein SAMN05216377_110128 [Pseudonocardia oroxyli]